MAYKAETLELLSEETAIGAAREMLTHTKREFGFIPNMYAAMANQPALLAAYRQSYAAFRAEAGFTPAEQEVLFVTISRENGCRYCVAAHSLVADAMSNVPPAVTNAIRDRAPIPDAKLAALSQFAVRMIETRGQPSDADARAFLAAGYAERHIMGVILAISVKTLSNFTNHLFDTPLDAAFASRTWEG